MLLGREGNAGSGEIILEAAFENGGRMAAEGNREQSKCVVSMLPRIRALLSQQAQPEPVCAHDVSSRETTVCIQTASELEPNATDFYFLTRKNNNSSIPINFAVVGIHLTPGY